MASLEMNAALPHSITRTRGPSLLEWVFAVFAFTVYQGAIFPVLRSLGGGSAAAQIADKLRSGDLISRYSQLGVLVLLVMICLARWRRMLPALRSAWPLGVFLLLCFASAAWADRPELVLRRSVSLASVFLFGVYTYQCFGPRRFLMLIAASAGIASLLSIALYVVAPNLASDISYLSNRAISGVYSSKNGLSIANAVGLCAALSLLMLEGGLSPRGRAFFIILSLGMVVTLVLSRGTGALLNFIIVSTLILTLALRGVSKIRFIFAYAVFCVVMVGLYFVLFDLPDVLALLDKDSSLTGRLPLWAECIKAIYQKPVLGWGYSAFWDIDSVRTQYIWDRIGWDAENAHNAYLELALDVGLVGALLYVGILFTTAVTAIRYAGTRLPGAQWLLVSLISVFILSLDEGTFAAPDEIAVQIAFGVCLAHGLRRSRRTA